jgi:hypothetical protein
VLPRYVNVYVCVCVCVCLCVCIYEYIHAHHKNLRLLFAYMYFILHVRKNSRRNYKLLETGRRIICRFLPKKLNIVFSGWRLRSGLKRVLRRTMTYNAWVMCHLDEMAAVQEWGTDGGGQWHTARELDVKRSDMSRNGLGRTVPYRTGIECRKWRGVTAKAVRKGLKRTVT